MNIRKSLDKYLDLKNKKIRNMEKEAKSPYLKKAEEIEQRRKMKKKC